jgi:uncharacterized protein (DUF2249 family)
MNIDAFIQDVGGRQVIIEMTGLTKGRISQWVTENHVPRPWRKYLSERFPAQSKKHGLINGKKRA